MICSSIFAGHRRRSIPPESLYRKKSSPGAAMLRVVKDTRILDQYF